MAVESPPAFLQASSFGAEQTRRAITNLLQRGATVGSIAGGVVEAGDMALSAPGSGMSVLVAPGEAWIGGTSSATQAGYYGRVASTTTLAIAASDPSNPRVDRVVAVVADAAYSGAANTFTVAVTTGTPSAGATLVNLTGVGSAPVSSLTLGYVLVPAGATNIIGGDVETSVGTVQTGLAAPLVTTLPVSGFDGQLVNLLVDSSHGIVWQFRYRAGSGSTYKWEFIGGPPLYAEATPAGLTYPVSYATFSGAPSLTLPILPNGGDFDVLVGQNLVGVTPPSAYGFMASYAVGGTGPQDIDASTVLPSVAGSSSDTVQRRKTGMGSATTFAVEVRNIGGSGSVILSSGTFRVWLAVLPVRVG